MSLPRQRVTLITLGVADLDRARRSYAAWGWTPSPSDAEGVVFSQMHGAALALFPLDELAADQGGPEPRCGSARSPWRRIAPTLPKPMPSGSPPWRPERLR